MVKHGAWKHGTTTIAVGAAFPRAPFDTLAAVDWVDLLIIGLMLLAAVHGLRLGALVQLLTFGGFFLGFLLGTVVWVPLLQQRAHGDVTRSVLVVSLVLFTACALGYAGRVIGTWSNVTVRRHHLGNVDAVLGVGVAVLAVLLSVWVVAAVILSPNSRFTSLDAAVARSDILHSIDGVLPQAPSIFNDLQTFLNDQGFPQVFSTLTPPSTPSVSTPTNAETKALADPAVFSTVKILGTACSSEQEGSGFVVGPGLVATNAHVVAGESNGNTQVLLGNSAYNATPVLFDPDFDLAVLRTDAPLGPALDHQPEPGLPGHAGRDPRLSRGPGPDHRCRRRDGGGHRHRQGHLQQRLGHEGRLRARCQRAAREFRRSAARTGRPGHRRRLLPFHRLPERRLRPHVARGPGPGAGGGAAPCSRQHRPMHLGLNRQARMTP